MKAKRVLVTLLAAAMCAGLLGACGSTPPANSTGDATQAPQETAAPATDAPEGTEAPKPTDAAAPDAASGDIPTLLWWNIGGTPNDLAEWTDVVNAYLVEKIGVKLDFKQSNWGDWGTKMNTIINSGENFDIMFVNGGNYSQFVNMGAFADITELVQSAAPTLWSFVPQLVWDGVKIGGKIYAVPTYKDSSITQYWMFDHAYVEKYALDLSAIKTFQDLDAPLRKIKEGEGRGVYPIHLSQGSTFNGFFNEYDSLASGIPALGVKVTDETRKVVATLEQEDVQANLRLLHSWYKDGIINPDAPTLKEAEKQAIFSTAQGWPSAAGIWATNNGVEKYDVFQVFGPIYTTDSIQGSLNAISANSKYKEESLKLLEFVNSDHKIRDMLAYGIEGKHFEYISEDIVHKLTDTWTMPGYSQATFFNMSTPDDGDPNQWEEVRKLNEEATASVCNGFALDISNLSAEIANCKTVWEKYSYELLTGASDPDEKIPEIMKDLRANGLDTLIQEAQKQIDAYYAK